MFDFKKSMKALTESKKQLMGESVDRPGIDASVIDTYRKKIKVFVFETLMNPEVRAAVLKTDIETETDVIHNWKEISIESEAGQDYHTIVASLGSSTHGLTLYVSEEQLAKLDYWEDQYDRKKVMLGRGSMAFVYVLNVDYMRDRGQNTDVELSPDDISQLAWAADNM